MREQPRHPASKAIELALAGALLTLLLAVLYPNLRSPSMGALVFWSLAVSLPGAAIAFGCLWQRPAASLIGWTILLVETALLVHR